MKPLIFINNYDEIKNICDRDKEFFTRVKVELELIADNVEDVDNFTKFIYSLDEQLDDYRLKKKYKTKNYFVGLSKE